MNDAALQEPLHYAMLWKARRDTDSFLRLTDIVVQTTSLGEGQCPLNRAAQPREFMVHILI